MFARLYSLAGGAVLVLINALTIRSMGPLQALANLRFATAHFTANSPSLTKAP